MGFRRAFSVVLSLFCFAVDALWALRRRDGAGGGGERRLLLIRVDRIGDFVLWMPAARVLIDHYRRLGYGIAMVVARECQPLARRLDGVDEIRVLDRNAFRLNPAYRTAVLSTVRELGATLALQPTYSRIPGLGDALVRASGAERRVGWTGDLANTTALEKYWGDRAYTTLLPNPEDAAHELQRNESLLTALDVARPPVARDPVSRPAADVGPPQGGWPEPPYYILLPGASSPLRRWPARHFAAIADRMHGAFGWPGVICGGPGDTGIARQVIGFSGAPLRDLTGRTDLDQLARVLAAAKLVFGNDSGPLHVAAEVSAPSVCILGGGQFGRFLPYVPTVLHSFRAPHPVYRAMPCFGCDWKCRYRSLGLSAAPCVDGITVEAAWLAVSETLSPASSGASLSN